MYLSCVLCPLLIYPRNSDTFWMSRKEVIVLASLAETRYRPGAPGLPAWALLVRCPELECKSRSCMFVCWPHLTDSLLFCSLWASVLIDVVVSFPLVRIPFCLGHLYFLLLTEKLHQEACSGDELAQAMHVGPRAVHFQTGWRNEFSRRCWGWGTVALVKLTFKLIAWREHWETDAWGLRGELNAHAVENLSLKPCGCAEQAAWSPQQQEHVHWRRYYGRILGLAGRVLFPRDNCFRNMWSIVHWTRVFFRSAWKRI